MSDSQSSCRRSRISTLGTYGLVGLTVLALAPGRLLAQAPAASYVAYTFPGQVCVPGNTAPFPFSCEYDITTPTFSFSGRAATTGGLLPTADVQHAVTGSGRVHTRAAVIYNVVVRPVGAPPPGAQVPLRIRGAGEVTVSSGSSLQQATGGVHIMGWGAGAAAQGGSDTASLNVDEIVTVTPNAALEVRVIAWVDHVFGVEGVSGEGQAVVDPEIVIDPAFPDAADYFLEFSENLWAIFTDGFETGSLSGWSGSQQ